MKDHLLHLLFQQAGVTVSGAQLAKDMGISRVMVHKYIEALRHEGYQIASYERRGYQLIWPDSEVNPARVSRMLTGQFGHKILWRPKVTSTQDELSRLIYDGQAESGQVLVAREQTAGRGRRGRAWIAEPGGLWFSLYLKTNLPMVQIPKLSLVFSLAIVKVLVLWCSDVSIKWPNDLMIQEKKVGGILLNLQGEANDTSDLVVGVGINVNCPPPRLGPEDKHQTTSLHSIYGEIIPIDELFASILNSMESLYNSYRDGNWDIIISEYRYHCNHLGRTITVHQGDEYLAGINTMITDDGGLELMVAGRQVVLHSGDII